MFNQYFKKDINFTKSSTDNIIFEKAASPMFKDILYLWLNNNSICLKQSTISKYEYIIRVHIGPELGQVKLCDLNSSCINQYLLNKIQNGRIDNQGGLSASYVNSIILIINSALDFAAKESIYVFSKPTIYKPPLRKKSVAVLSIEHQHTLEKYLFENIGETEIAVLIALYTGMRLGEICALTWEDVDFNKQIIHIRSTVSRVNNPHLEPGSKTKYVISSPKTVASDRYIPLHSILVGVLNKKREPSFPYVTSNNETFTNPRTLEYRYSKLLKQAKIPYINFHSLRHTFATRCIESGIDMKTLSEILGHSSVSFTMDTYVHSSQEIKKRNIEKLRCINYKVGNF